MKNCAKCTSRFPNWIIVDGKRKKRVLSNRTLEFCLEEKCPIR